MNSQELNRKLKSIYKTRLDLMEKQQEKLLRLIAYTEDRLLNMIIDDILEVVVNNDGKIDFDGDPVNFSKALDKIYDEFIKNENVKIVDRIASDFIQLLNANSHYYSLIETDKNRFKKAREAVKEIMLERLGISSSGKLKRGGYLDSLFRDTTVREKIKQLTYKSVAAQIPIKDYIQILRKTITGQGDLDGLLTRYYKGFAFDTYQQFDRANNSEYAKALELSAFIYEGGLIETSRKFCIERNGKVFTVDEAQEWINDKDLPKTKEEKETGIVVYNPLIDMGRFNCRHMVRFVSNEIAIMLRPDLKNKLAA
jgi:hypothetical protein